MSLARLARSILLAVVALAVAGGALAFVPAVDALAPLPNTPVGFVNTGRLNVRTGPGVGFPVLTIVDQWNNVYLLGRNADASWAFIRTMGNVEGWVNAFYVKADVSVWSLPVVGTIGTVAPASTAAVVGVGNLELRSGPGASFGVIAILGQGQAVTLLGRTADSAWVKVNAPGIGEGWTVAQVGFGGQSVTPYLANVVLSTLPVLSQPVTGPRARLSVLSARPGTPIYVTFEGFPGDRDVAVVVTSPQMPIGFVAVHGRTDGAGFAQLFFSMPANWPNGALITETHLSVAAGTTDGAVLIWNGLRYTP
jgi:uncharacterized protein YraI